jgi:cellulose synthase/poly-beta-1,6-N-acetylglucosamine synthase-like glycosyltransferase
LILVSDGSTDATVDIALRQANCLARVINLPDRVGKACALTAGCSAAKHDVIVFADARQTWTQDTLRALLENFGDPTVGAASGDLVLGENAGSLRGVGLYWRYEKWLRRQESLVGSAVGVSGSVSAVRRELVRPIPAGTILDDVYWPLLVAMQGYRVVHDERAAAYDRLPTRSRDEFRRKVRTLCGNFQLVRRLPSAIIPWRNPLWWNFVSHKICRLIVPWALVLMLILSAILSGPFFRIALAAQVLGYSLGMFGLWQGQRCRIPLASAASSFLLLNAAAWLAFWVWISGRAESSWKKIPYMPTGALARS